MYVDIKGNSPKGYLCKFEGHIDADDWEGLAIYVFFVFVISDPLLYVKLFESWIKKKKSEFRYLLYGCELVNMQWCVDFVVCIHQQ